MPQLAPAGRLAFRSVRAAAITRCSSPSRSVLLSGLHWMETGQSRNTYASYSEHGIKRVSLNRPSRGSEEQTQAINVNSIEEFELLAEQSKADIPIARSFLVKSRKKLAELPLEKQREEAAKVGAGRLLSWLWKYREEGTRDADLDQDFCDALCWHLAAEGRDNFVWEWLKIETAGTGKRSHDTTWNGRPLAGMVAAHLYWDRSLDGAIALFLTAARTFGREIHLVGAYTCIDKAAKVRSPERVLPCSPALFDAFVDAAKFTHTCVHLSRQRGALMLFHPTQADATLYMQWCKARNQCPEKYKLPTRGPAQRSEATIMARASYILRLQGQKEDAEWLDANIQNMHSSWAKEWFTSIYSEAREDPRLKTLFDSSPNAGEVLEIIRRNSHHETSRPVSVVRQMVSNSVAPHLHQKHLAGPTSVEEFTALVARGEADIKLAVLFLRQSKAKLETSGLSMTKLRSEMAYKKAGGKVLAWFWDHIDDARQNNDSDSQFADLLTWHLQGEGLDHLIWERLSQIEQRSEQNRWNGRLLGGLITATIEWESIDSAIKKFHGKENRVRKTVPGGRAIGRISHALTQPDALPCSPELFAHHLNRQKSRSQQVALPLYHPIMPDCDPLMDYLREDRDGFYRFVTETKVKGVMYLLRASYILRLKGRMREAELIDGIARSSELYRPPYQYLASNFLRDSRLNSLHEKSAFVNDAVAAIEGLR